MGDATWRHLASKTDRYVQRRRCVPSPPLLWRCLRRETIGSYRCVSAGAGWWCRGVVEWTWPRLLCVCRRGRVSRSGGHLSAGLPQHVGLVLLRVSARIPPRRRRRHLHRSLAHHPTLLTRVLYTGWAKNCKATNSWPYFCTSNPNRFTKVFQ